MSKIILIGSSGHAKSIIDVIEKQKKYELIGLIDSYLSVGERTLGYKVIGKIADIPQIAKQYGVDSGIIGVGDNWKRCEISQKIIRVYPNFSFISVVDPSAHVGKCSSIGKGTVIFQNVVVGPESNIGEHCVLNTNSSINHDSTMGNFSTLSPHTSTGGNVSIGQHSFIGIGSNIIQGVSIGSNVIVGAGSVVLENLPTNSLAYGHPAKVVRKIPEGYNMF